MNLKQVLSNEGLTVLIMSYDVLRMRHRSVFVARCNSYRDKMPYGQKPRIKYQRSELSIVP